MWVSVSDKYEVSTEGHIRNKKTKRILHEFVGKDGYVRTQFDGKTRVIHRTVAAAFLPIDDDRSYVNHKDGDKTNNNSDNLEWCTRSENMTHAYKHGLKSSVGTKNGRCKLSIDDVAFIKKHYKPFDKTYGAKALAERFGVAHQTVSAVVHGQNWVE